MDKELKKSHIELDNLAIPEVRFEEEVLENDAESDNMSIASDNLAIPEVRVGKLAREKNEELKLTNAASAGAEAVKQAVSSGKPMHISSDNLAIPEVRFEEEATENATVEEPVVKKKMKIDYSGAVPQITYE